jgi:hypothetical protein
VGGKQAPMNFALQPLPLSRSSFVGSSPTASASYSQFIRRDFETYCSSPVKSDNVLPKCC